MTQLVALLPLRLDDVDGGTDVGRTLSTHSEIKEEKENDTAYFTINKKENLLIPFSDLSLKKNPFSRYQIPLLPFTVPARPTRVLAPSSQQHTDCISFHFLRLTKFVRPCYCRTSRLFLLS